MQPSPDPIAIAARFVAARRAGVALPDYPGRPPASLDEAYRIQDAAIMLHGDSVAGWKVGRINPPRGGIDRLAGPIFADRIMHAADGFAPAMPVCRDGFIAAEAEFLLRIGSAPDPGCDRFTPAEARALVDAVHVGIEVAGSPYPRINADGPLVTVSDFGNNSGLVVGPAVADWRDADLDRWPVELRVGDAVIGTGIAADMLDGPFGAVAFVAAHLAARGRPLAPGQWISTGAVTGVHPVSVGDTVTARFGTGDADHRVACMIRAQD